jgi:NADH-quinone oxidoreductase E subunit
LNRKQGASLAGGEAANILVLLKKAQGKYGHVPPEAIAEIAQSLKVPIGDVYGTATFYSFLSVKPLGRHIIRVCRSLPCYLKNSELIIKTIEDTLGIKPGGTTPDGQFSLQLTNCIGGCDQAPAMLVNDDRHGNLTPARITEILNSYQQR